MEVILNQTIPKVGRTGDVVKVADGYARNFLIPRGLAMEANRANRKTLEGTQRANAKKADSIAANAESLKAQIDGQTITLTGRTAPNSTKLFGAVTSQNVADAIKEKLKVDVDKRTIGLLHPIKTSGAHEVVLHLHSGVDAKITVDITPVEA